MQTVNVNGRRVSITKFQQMHGLHVSGSLYLRGCTVLTTLPDGLRVGGSLDLSGCTALTTVSGLTVGESLNLSGCTALTALPDDLHIGGSLDLSGCTALTTVSGLTVSGSLYLRGCTALRNIFRAGADARGYEFYGAQLANGWRILAGCRNFSPAEAREHWAEGTECRMLAERVIAAGG